MAAPGNKYFIEDKLTQPAEHHESFRRLWETKWKPLCDMGVYPFMFGTTRDFQPIVDEIIAADLKPPYDWDKYASYFLPPAYHLTRRAKSESDKNKASEMFLRASALYRIARFPAPRSEQQNIAWELGKRAALRGLMMQKYPMVEVKISHSHATNGDRNILPAYYHLPASASATNKVPLVIIFCGLDGYRTELAVWKDGFARLNVALLVVEIPGTGDNPGTPSDPESPDRVWTSMFEWIGRQTEIDQSKVANWGFSTGGYYSVRVAHTHPGKLKGVVALGGGCHHMFDPKWLDAANSLEYPFEAVYHSFDQHKRYSLALTLCHKFGYGTDYERFKKEVRDHFSLLETGILDRPGCARLLLVNGTEDEVFPIDDYYLCLQHGDPKEVRFVTGRKHMGEPESFIIILEWLFKLLEIPGNAREFVSTIPFKAQYL